MRGIWAVLCAVVLAGSARAEPITLTVGHSEHRTMFEELARRFSSSRPDMRVVLEAASPTYPELTQRVLRSALAGEAPDVLFQGFNLVPEIAERGLSTPLDDLVAAEPDWAARGYTPELMALGVVDGKIHAVPFAISVPVVFYNPDLVRRAGGDPDRFPTSWPEIAELGRAIDALAPETLGGFFRYHGVWRFEGLVLAAGGQVMTPDRREVAFDGPEGLEALRTLRRFGEAGMVDMSPNQARQAFAAGSLGVLATSSSWTATLNDQVAGRFTLRAAPVPLTPAVGKLPSGGNAPMILTRDPVRRRAAWDLIEFATGPAGQALMVERSGYVPANTVAVTTPELRRFYADNPVHLTAVGMMPHLAPWRAFAGENSVKIYDVMEQHLRAVVTQEATPEAALETMAADVRALLPLE